MIRDIKIPKKIETALPAVVCNINSHIRSVINDIEDTMRKHSYKSLSAPHIGFPYKISLINLDLIEEKIDQSGILVMINPRVVDGLGDIYVEEKFLSDPDKLEPRLRAYISIVEYHDIDGNEKEISAINELSVIVQHELDCVEGLRF